MNWFLIISVQVFVLTCFLTYYLSKLSAQLRETNRRLAILQSEARRAQGLPPSTSIYSNLGYAGEMYAGGK